MLKLMQEAVGWRGHGLNKRNHKPHEEPFASLQSSRASSASYGPQGDLSDRSRTDGHSLRCHGSIGWAEKFIWVFLSDVMEKPK